MKNDKRLTELIWAGKYDKVELEGKAPTERPNLPFQVVETVNETRLACQWNSLPVSVFCRLHKTLFCYFPSDRVEHCCLT